MYLTLVRKLNRCTEFLFLPSLLCSPCTLQRWSMHKSASIHRYEKPFIIVTANQVELKTEFNHRKQVDRLDTTDLICRPEERPYSMSNNVVQNNCRAYDGLTNRRKYNSYVPV